jgi:hypothetical protein
LNNKLNRAVFNISQRTKDIVLYIQVSKILQGDEDAALDPYLKPEKLKETDFSKLKKGVSDFCSRLGDYKQPVCWSAVPIFSEDDESVILPNKITQFYRNKGVMSDVNFIHLFGNEVS